MKRYFRFFIVLLIILSFTTLYAKKLNLDENNKRKDVVVQTRDTTSDDAVSIGGKLIVDGLVDGDAVSVGGIVDIDGKITGDLVVIGGTGNIGPNTEVEGSFVNIGSSLNIDKKAVFHGEKTSINLGPINRLIGNHYLMSHGRTSYRRGPFSFVLRYDISWIRILSKSIISYLLALAIVVLFKKGTRNVERTMNINPFATFLAGFLVELLIIPLMIILAISVIGIPFIPIFLLALFVALIFGGAVTTYMIGKYTVNKIGKGKIHISLVVLVGTVVIAILPLLSLLISMTNIGWLNILFLSLTFTEMYIILTYAFGSVTLSLFGTRIYKNEVKDDK